jgi:hypothetical protein
MPGGTEESHEKPVSVVGIRAEIWSRDLPNMKQECKSLDHNIRSVCSWNAYKCTAIVFFSFSAMFLKS